MAVGKERPNVISSEVEIGCQDRRTSIDFSPFSGTDKKCQIRGDEKSREMCHNTEMMLP